MLSSICSARGLIKSNKMKFKPVVSKNAIGKRTIPKCLLSILLVLLLFSAISFLGNYKLNQGEDVCNLYSDYSAGDNMCKGLNYSLDWNKLMKIVNGNREHTVTIAHWNGGSSQIGKSAKGIEN